MYGLEAINASNGWAISGVGISIVFTGLVMLAFVISQLHMFLALWEDPSKFKKLFQTKKIVKPSKEDEMAQAARTALTGHQKEVIKQFSFLVRTMDDHFSLSRLLYLAKISDLKDPYENLNNLYKTKIIIPDGDGFFTWDKEVFDKIVRQ
ncbi:MAG: OadG family protein [Pseudomonadota bacterium]